MSQLSDVQLRHLNMVLMLAKPGEKIVAELTAAEAHLWHMATGVAGEAGELLDAFKKAVVYKKALDVKNVVEELGDLEFYMAGIRAELGLQRDDILQANMDKLAARYKGHRYTDDQAQLRADKTTAV